MSSGIRKVGVVGIGLMGSGIAQVAASQERDQIEESVPALVPEWGTLVTTEQTSGCMFKSDQKLSRVPFKVQAVLG